MHEIKAVAEFVERCAQGGGVVGPECAPRKITAKYTRAVRVQNGGGVQKKLPFPHEKFTFQSRTFCLVQDVSEITFCSL